jgi:hypothetical protein
VYLSASYEGAVSERRIADELPIPPPGSVERADLGLLGYNPAGVTMIRPARKPRKKPLSEELKAENTEKARLRVLVEHAIGGVKIARIVKDTIRTRRTRFNEIVMPICCGLHNLRRTLILGDPVRH